MSEQKPCPGVSRSQRLTDTGLERLQKHLTSGTRMQDMILAQWIRRYGEPARALIRQHGRYIEAFDEISNP